MLSILNPLQYLPVVGTIYRAVTGDQIPEAARRIGSLIVSTLMGGPIGAVINIASMAAEKITGINLDKLGQKLVDDVTEGGSSVSTAQAAQPAPGTAGASHGAAAASQSRSPVASAPAAIASSSDENPPGGKLSEADLLNALELSRLAGAAAAYGQVQEVGQPSSLHTLA